ncbi:MAG: hypothetical protein FJ253_07120, partial [Phycisphaerae bacterium]|nr:hypothetical protein [Phycisphaerae bacterium]
CFDLAQERSIGFELRSAEALGAPESVILRRGLGAVASSALLAALATALLARSASSARRVGAAGAAGELVPRSAARRGFAGRAGEFAPLIVLALLPISMMAWRMIAERRPWDFVAVHGEGAINSLLIAAGAGAGAAFFAIGHAMLALDAAAPSRRRRPAALEWTLIGGWIAMSILPSAIVAGAMIEAWSAPFGGALLDRPEVMIAGAIARFGAVAALAGAAAGRLWSRRCGELERLDATASFTQPASRTASAWSRRAARIRSRSPLLATAALSGGVAVAALAAGEIAVSTRLEPPGTAWISSSILSAIHYQRPGAAMAAMLVAALASLAAAALAVSSFRRLARVAGSNATTGATAILLSTMLVFASSCGEIDDGACRPLDGAVVIGGPGVVDGRFDRPRAVAIEPSTGEIVAIDKTARVQRFARDGRFLSAFRMPEFEVGMPVGVSFDHDGTLLVPDTHYHRVVAYDRDGRERWRFGRYGSRPGEFIYPTDVLPLADGSLLIGEYGGGDRLQIVRRDGAPLRAVGPVSKDPAEATLFERPQSLALSRDGRELFVVDSCNHRIQVLDAATGDRIRILGRAGSGPGELSYPWAVVLLPDDSLLIAEQGNSRLQRLDPRDGSSLALLGGRGRDPGRLDRPWALDLDLAADRVVIADTGNNRLLAVPLSTILSAPIPSADAR